MTRDRSRARGRPDRPLGDISNLERASAILARAELEFILGKLRRVIEAHAGHPQANKAAGLVVQFDGDRVATTDHVCRTLAGWLRQSPRAVERINAELRRLTELLSEDDLHVFKGTTVAEVLRTEYKLQDLGLTGALQVIADVTFYLQLQESRS